MRDWLSAAELASLGLPGLPATERGWREHAEREGWLEREGRLRLRKGKGGGLEYHVDLLPEAALAAYAAQTIGAVELPGAEAEAAAIEEGQAQLTLPALETRDARLALIAAADRFARGGTLSRHTADRAFASLYNVERIAVEPWLRAAAPKISAASLARWRRSRRQKGSSALGFDRGAARRGEGALDRGGKGKVRAFLLAAIAHQPHLSGDHLQKLAIAAFPELAGVSLRSFQRLSAPDDEDEIDVTGNEPPPEDGDEIVDLEGFDDDEAPPADGADVDVGDAPDVE